MEKNKLLKKVEILYETAISNDLYFQKNKSENLAYIELGKRIAYRKIIRLLK